MMIHALPGSIGFISALVRRAAAAFARRMATLNARIDAQPPIAHHRMGAWETAFSPAAQRALSEQQADAADATKSDADQRARANRIVSENG